MSALILYAAAEARTIVSLPLDKSPIADECGNTWTAEGSCVISDVNPKTSTMSPRPALQFDGGIILGRVDGYMDELFHFACVYDHAKGSVSLYLNGELKDSVDVKLQPRKYSLVYIGKSSHNDPLFIGYVYGFRVTDGEALWKDSFTPPKQYSFVPPNVPAGNGMQFMCPCCKYFLEHYGGQLPASK